MTTAVSEENQLDALIKMGFPTFDEFRKNPDKYRGKTEELLECVDTANVFFRERLGRRHKIMWRDQYECDSLEQLQRYCTLEGFKESDLEMEPKVRSLGGTGKHERFEIVVHFWPRFEFRFRGGIVAND